MVDIDSSTTITTVEQLAALYGQPNERSVLKELDHLDEHCQAFIAASPFMLLATSGASGGDCSPRGDAPGFVTIADANTLLIPDRRGNNRADSLRNIIENPAVGLLFLIPGVIETFRVNGRAHISIDPALLARFEVNGKLPRSVLVVHVDSAYVQCARALVRSELWNPERHARRADLPSMGTILAAATCGKVDAAEYDAQNAAAIAQSLY